MLGVDIHIYSVLFICLQLDNKVDSFSISVVNLISAWTEKLTLFQSHFGSVTK